jgi:hypothetical protein
MALFEPGREQGEKAPGAASRILRTRWPAGTTRADRSCWLCGGPTQYRHCKIVCPNCGFTRDCSDP